TLYPYTTLFRSEQRAHAKLTHFCFAQERNFRTGSFETSDAALDEALRVDHVRRLCDQLASELDTGDHRLLGLPSGFRTIRRRGYFHFRQRTLLLVLQASAISIMPPGPQPQPGQHRGKLNSVEPARVERQRGLTRGHILASQRGPGTLQSRLPPLAILTRTRKRDPHHLPVPFDEAFEHLCGLTGEARRLGTLRQCALQIGR